MPSPEKKSNDAHSGATLDESAPAVAEPRPQLVAREKGANEADSSTTVPESAPVVTEPEPDLDEYNQRPEKVSRARRLYREHPRRSVAAIVVAVAILLGIVYFIRSAYLYEDTDDAQVDGYVKPLSARITGHVLEVKVIEGQFVHAGDVLVVIDPKDYEVSVAQARANYADAQASASSSRFNVPITAATARSNLDSSSAAVINAEAGVMGAQQDFAAAKANVAQAEANLAKSAADLVRYERLVAKEDVSRQQYDQAVAAAKADEATLAANKATAQSKQQALVQAQGKLTQARADRKAAGTAPQQISLTRAKADSADAQVLARKAELDQAELNLGYTVIRSPVNGIVGRRNAEIGQNVSIGQQLISVVSLDDVFVTANFKETQLAHMRPGQSVTIKVDAYGRSWKGHVTNMGGGTGSIFSVLPPENATGNYVKVVQRVPVRIDFDRTPGQDFNSEGLLKPGLSVVPDVRVR
jgi:membrane fusion protein, multidrug efflux system